MSYPKPKAWTTLKHKTLRQTQNLKTLHNTMNPKPETEPRAFGDITGLSDVLPAGVGPTIQKAYYPKQRGFSVA